jgi:hypothetical protein
MSDLAAPTIGSEFDPCFLHDLRSGPFELLNIGINHHLH